MEIKVENKYLGKLEILAVQELELYKNIIEFLAKEIKNCLECVETYRVEDVK